MSGAIGLSQIGLLPIGGPYVPVYTAGDIVSFALRASGVLGVGQTALAQDTADGLFLLNTLLSEWQINRWLVYDLVTASITSTGAVSYTVGPTGTFVTNAPRPDRVDAAYATLISSGADTILYPFQSREGYDRTLAKTTTGTPERYWYDPAFGDNGIIYFVPVPSSLWQLQINIKSSLPLAPTTDTPLQLPQPYIVALIWNLARDLRPVYQEPEDPQVTARAAQSLAALVISIAQVPGAVLPRPAGRAGVYSSMLPPQISPPQQGSPQ